MHDAMVAKKQCSGGASSGERSRHLRERVPPASVGSPTCRDCGADPSWVSDVARDGTFADVAEQRLASALKGVVEHVCLAAAVIAILHSASASSSLAAHSARTVSAPSSARGVTVSGSGSSVAASISLPVLAVRKISHWRREPVDGKVGANSKGKGGKWRDGQARE